MYHNASNKFQFKLIWFRGDAFEEFQYLMATILAIQALRLLKVFMLNSAEHESYPAQVKMPRHFNIDKYNI